MSAEQHLLNLGIPTNLSSEEEKYLLEERRAELLKKLLEMQVDKTDDELFD